MIPDCCHEWEPAGMLGPYPVENCTRCNTGAVCAAPGYPPPFGVIIGALERQGCNPRPVEEPER